MRSVVRALGRFGVFSAYLTLVMFSTTPAAGRGGCLEMPDGELICDPTSDDEKFFREHAYPDIPEGPPKAPPDALACRSDKEGRAFAFEPPPANASLDRRLCALMLSTGALPFGASRTSWMDPTLAYSSRRFDVWDSLKVSNEDLFRYVSRVNAGRANRFWPLHLKRLGGPPARYTIVEYEPSRTAPIEQFSTAQQMRLCFDDFQQQLRRAQSFLKAKLAPIHETLPQRGILTVADDARRPGYFIEGEFIRLEIWFGLWSAARKGPIASILCRPFLFFQDLKDGESG